MRIVALLCLAVFLAASIAASIHTHTPAQDAACLICHVTHRASVVAICTDAGKPHSGASHRDITSNVISTIPDPPGRIRIPRAPPSHLLAIA